ncbi:MULTISPECIES: FGGY-family carbohydrate kinase [unclassified Bradyrhizobium]|uniref:FGGY-family carbohydrate kinase n=1 Tax=unclassified Bradyrhizobium TaxID=2631580 RepID=UPI00247B04B6|nr:MULTISPECIES: FGGY-family carbohydrate kinase [unclassified Bradyrhizobium]WGS18132.1 FGGY-family carbohydrate kinase [Bradyrhizobium sp. ISRA463]WGS24946.1 FGGY-family carbohydrate kinase [Bradyrhizobium sp. ISRA464]
MTGLFLGIDIGTGGVRACTIDARGDIQGMESTALPPPRQDGNAIDQDPELWWHATVGAMRKLGGKIDLARVERISVDGTSGTLLLIDAAGQPRTPGLMYNDARASAEAARILDVSAADSGAHGASSALAKLLHLLSHAERRDVRFAVHQADWIAGRLAGRHGISDENNALKLGYDPITRTWPAWLDRLDVPRELLPKVLVPGTPFADIDPSAAAMLGLPRSARIAAGTTDGVAAFIATRADAPGDAVTSLGTTLVVKLLAAKPIFAANQGVYSHRLGESWLAGGASNSGGGALLAHFTAAEMERLTPQLSPEEPTGLDYYPLAKPGERFPIADPALPARVTPRPPEDHRFFQALLEGIASVEALAYLQLSRLGAPPLRRVISIGGGARNNAWTEIRHRRLGVPVTVAEQTEASYGAALLALRGGPT